MLYVQVAAVVQVTAEGAVDMLEGVAKEDLVADGEVITHLQTPLLMIILLRSSSELHLTVISQEARRMRSTAEHQCSLVHQPTAISHRSSSSINSTDKDNMTILISNSRLTISRTIATEGVVEVAGVVAVAEVVEAAGVVAVIGEVDDDF
jgi:hypothetical protein